MKEQGKKKKKGSSLKQQLRGVERLLKRDLTPEARAVHEKKLREIKNSMENKKKQELERKYSKKYHMVKFFEKKKVTRAIKKVERQLMEEKDEQAIMKLREEEEQLREDLDYIVHFPNDMKYVSLFKTADKEKVEKMKVVVRERISQAIAKSLDQPYSEDEMDSDEGIRLLLMIIQCDAVKSLWSL